MAQLRDDLLSILDDHDVPEEARLFLQRCKLTSARKLGGVQKHEFQKDVLGRIKWQCPEEEVIGNVRAIECAWEDCKASAATPLAPTFPTVIVLDDDDDPLPLTTPRPSALKVENPVATRVENNTTVSQNGSLYVSSGAAHGPVAVKVEAVASVPPSLNSADVPAIEPAALKVEELANPPPKPTRRRASGATFEQIPDNRTGIDTGSNAPTATRGSTIHQGPAARSRNRMRNQPTITAFYGLSEQPKQPSITTYFLKSETRPSPQPRDEDPVEDNNISVQPDTSLRKRGNTWIQTATQNKTIDFELVYNVLNSIAWKSSMQRPNVQPDAATPVQTFTLGLTRDFSKKYPVLSGATQSLPDLAKTLTSWAASTCEDFQYTSIALNKDFACKLHVDANNAGISRIIALGPFSGGMLWVFDEQAYKTYKAGTTDFHEDIVWVKVQEPLRGWLELEVGSEIPGRAHDIRGIWFEFDGNKPHMTLPFQGSRISLVLYTRAEWSHASQEVRSALAALNFPLPAFVACGVELVDCDVEGTEIPEEHDDILPHVKCEPKKPTTPLTRLHTDCPHCNNDYPCEAAEGRREHILLHLSHAILHDAQRPCSFFDNESGEHMSFGGTPILVHGLCQIGKSWDITVAAWLAYFRYDTIPLVLLLNSHEAMKQFMRSVLRFNDFVKLNLQTGFPGLDDSEVQDYCLSPRDYFSRYCQGATLIMKLTNVSRLRQFMKYELGGIEQCPGGKYKITIISDEQDLDIQSASGSRGGVEKRVQTLQARCFQSVGHTATIAAQAFASRHKLRLVRMPVPPNYYGFSTRVPPERRPVFCETSSGFDGIKDMIDDILQPGACSRVALIHNAVLKKAHEEMQRRLTEHFAGKPLLVFTHNGGGGVKDGISATTCIGTIEEQEALLEQLAHHASSKKFQKESVRSIGHPYMRILFEASLTIAEALTAVRKLMCKDEYQHLASVIISGQMGGRAVTFKCTDHRLHLSDIFFTFDGRMHAEHMIQMVNRISGIYEDRPLLRLWTTVENYHAIRKYHDAIDKIAETLEEGASEEDPFELLQDFALDLPHTSTIPFLTRQRVEESYRLEPVRNNFMPKPHLHGGMHLTPDVGDVETIEPEVVQRIVRERLGVDASTEVKMIDEVQTFTLQALGFADSFITRLSDFPKESKDTNREVHKALKEHLGLRLCFRVNSECSCSRRAIFPPELVKRDYYDAVYGWDAERQVIVLLRRTMSYEECQKFSEDVVKNDNHGCLLVWRALCAQSVAGMPVKMNIMVRNVISQGDDDAEVADERLLQYRPLNNCNFRSADGQAAGKRQKCDKRCGECFNCLRPAFKRRCLGKGGTVSDAEDDGEARRRRKEDRNFIKWQGSAVCMNS